MYKVSIYLEETQHSQTIQHMMVGLLVNNKLERRWKES